MNRIVLHWTAGSYAPSKIDKKHYHYLIDGNGNVEEGKFKVEDNIPPLKKNQYAAHAAFHNSNSIGVSLCGMHNAKENPFDPGKYPIRQIQVDKLVELCASLCEKYDIPIERVQCHSELPKQSGKWDINWIPGMQGPDGAGDIIRSMIEDKLNKNIGGNWLTSVMLTIITFVSSIFK